MSTRNKQKALKTILLKVAFLCELLKSHHVAALVNALQFRFPKRKAVSEPKRVLKVLYTFEYGRRRVMECLLAPLVPLNDGLGFHLGKRRRECLDVVELQCQEDSL